MGMTSTAGYDIWSADVTKTTNYRHRQMEGDTSNPNQITQYLQTGGDILNPNQMAQHPHMGGDTSNPHIWRQTT